MKKFIAILATALVTIGLAGIGALPASAVQNKISGEASCDNGTVTILWTVSNSESDLWETIIQSDGNPAIDWVNYTVAPGGKNTLKQHGITESREYVVSIKAEWDNDNRDASGDSGFYTVTDEDIKRCAPEQTKLIHVEPQEPTLIPVCGLANDVWEFVKQDGVIWTEVLGGNSPGQRYVEASAADGYFIDQQTIFKADEDATACGKSLTNVAVTPPSWSNYTCDGHTVHDGGASVASHKDHDWFVTFSTNTTHNGSSLTAGVPYKLYNDIFTTKDFGDYEGDVTLTAKNPLVGVALTGTLTSTFTFAKPDCFRMATLGMCHESTIPPTSTNLDAHGWVLKNGTYVDGGVDFLGTAGNSAGATYTFPTPVHLSELGSLTTSAGPQDFIFTGGDLTSQLHYDGATGRFWTTQSGIFPNVRAGYYQSFSIDGTGMDEVGTFVASTDPLLGTLRLYIAPGVPVSLSSVTFDCMTQSFGIVAPVVFDQCHGSTTLPTSTNLDQHGWVLKPGTAQYVDGGMKLTSAAWDGGKVTLATNFTLAQAGAVAIDYTQGSGSGSVALLFNTSDGNQIHYEPFVGYTHPWFADQVGVFPLGGGGQGSQWSSTDLTDMVSNPIITSVVVGVWGAVSDVVTVHSTTFNCTTQSFTLDTTAPAPASLSTEALAAAALAAQAAADAASEVGRKLATTGVDSTGYVVGGALFLAVGALLLMLGTGYRRKFTNK